MTPQELIDLPGYGNAKEKLMELGLWKKTPIEEVLECIHDVRAKIDKACASLYQAELASLRVTMEDYK